MPTLDRALLAAALSELAPQMVLFPRQVGELNRLALRNLRGAHRKLAVVPGAARWFEERGALEKVARLASDSFGRHLVEAADQEVYASAE